MLMKLEIGCGSSPTPGYLHQDVAILPGLDFSCEPWQIPLKEGTLSEAIAVGVMEHLRFEEFDKTLKHIFVLLKREGLFLFDVPDMVVWSEYLFNVTHGMSYKNPFPDHHVWRTFYGWQRWPGDEHKSGWTREMLLSKASEIGFGLAEEGPQIFTSRGISRKRFSREGDAHLYLGLRKDGA
jgi:predicted SAM-dependent methyltransferase